LGEGRVEAGGAGSKPCVSSKNCVVCRGARKFYAILAQPPLVEATFGNPLGRVFRKDRDNWPLNYSRIVSFDEPSHLMEPVGLRPLVIIEEDYCFEVFSEKLQPAVARVRNTRRGLY